MKRCSARKSPVPRPTGRSLLADEGHLAPGNVVITPAVERLSRDTIDLLVIARDRQGARAGTHSLAEPFLYITSRHTDRRCRVCGEAVVRSRSSTRTTAIRARFRELCALWRPRLSNGRFVTR